MGNIIALLLKESFINHETYLFLLAIFELLLRWWWRILSRTRNWRCARCWPLLTSWCWCSPSWRLLLHVWARCRLSLARRRWIWAGRAATIAAIWIGSICRCSYRCRYISEQWRNKTTQELVRANARRRISFETLPTLRYHRRTVGTCLVVEIELEAADIAVAAVDHIDRVLHIDYSPVDPDIEVLLQGY